MTVDMVNLTDRIRDLIDYYTVGDDGEAAMVDLDAWNSDDLREIIGLLTVVLRERGDDSTLDDIYEDTFEDWIDRQIDNELNAVNIEEVWDEYVHDARTDS
jgi:hypothetical protein